MSAENKPSQDKSPNIELFSDSDLTYYKVLRDHVEHEDNLISQRISWLLLYNGFVIIGFVNILNALRDAAKSTTVPVDLGIVGVMLFIIYAISGLSIRVTQYIYQLVYNADASLYNLQTLARNAKVLSQDADETARKSYLSTRIVGCFVACASAIAGLISAIVKAIADRIPKQTPEKADSIPQKAAEEESRVRSQNISPLPPILWNRSSNPRVSTNKNLVLYGLLDTVTLFWILLMVAAWLITLLTLLSNGQEVVIFGILVLGLMLGTLVVSLKS